MFKGVDYGRLAVFCVVAVCFTVLVAMGKVDPKILGTLIPWLMPSPLKTEDKDEEK